MESSDFSSGASEDNSSSSELSGRVEILNGSVLGGDEALSVPASLTSPAGSSMRGLHCDDIAPASDRLSPIKDGNCLGSNNMSSFDTQCSVEAEVVSPVRSNVNSIPKVVVNEDIDTPEAADVLNGEVDVVVPVVGMVFENMLEVEAFYKTYAKQLGFGVTRTQGSYTNAKVRRATTWKCDCYGDPDTNPKRNCRRKVKDFVEGELKDKELRNPKRRNTKKCFCTAMIYATINEVEQWVIRKVVLDHYNHNPIPSNAKLMKEYRMQSFTGLTKRKIVNDVKAGVAIPNIHSSMACDRGGYDNMPFTEGDMRHVVTEVRRLKMEGGDANALLSYFGKMQRDNGNFFHTHRVDSKGFIKDILWVDARSSAAYEEFSDVVCFDTTYLTNQYLLPFANFVGVNHHGQSILFGCALISNEDCDTFEWVFKEWLGSMKGKAPGGILTDQAAAMRRPLEVVMPDTKHRWCIWHILKKLPYKFGSMKWYKKFKKELLEVIYNSLNVGSFEKGWNEVVEKYGLVSDEWLRNLFVERHMWIPAFMTDHFWAGMRSTQRVESMNSYFDKFLTRHTMLCEFGEKYTAAIERRIAQEKEADEKAMKWRRNYSTGYSVERFFIKLYTSNKFRVLQRECEKLTYCMVQEETRVDEYTYDYLMEDRVWVYPRKRSHPILTDAYAYYSVTYNAETKEAVCDCKMFETQGIMCRHLIRLYEKLHIVDLSQKYVLRRWRKDVVRKHSTVRVAYHDLSRTDEVKRLDKMVWAFEHVSDFACKNDRFSEIVLQGLKRIEADLHAACDEQQPQNQSTSQAESNGTTLVGSSILRTSDTFVRNSVCWTSVTL